MMRYTFGAICALRHEKEDLYHIAFAKQNISQSAICRLYRILCKQNISQKGMFMDNKTIKELAIELTVEITTVCDNIKGRSVYVNQLLRACSSIGANSHEAKYAQSRADFIHKMEIALKETYETEYWLEVLYKVKSLDAEVYKNLNSKCGTIRRKLIASITTAKNNQK